MTAISKSQIDAFETVYKQLIEAVEKIEREKETELDAYDADIVVFNQEGIIIKQFDGGLRISVTEPTLTNLLRYGSLAGIFGAEAVGIVVGTTIGGPAGGVAGAAAGMAISLIIWYKSGVINSVNQGQGIYFDLSYYEIYSMAAMFEVPGSFISWIIYKPVYGLRKKIDFAMKQIMPGEKLRERNENTGIKWGHSPDIKGSGRARALYIHFNNKTQFRLLFETSYFDSGEQATGYGPAVHLKTLEPSNQHFALVESRSGALFTGVSGGACWNIIYTNLEGRQEAIKFALGFSSPFNGKNKIAFAFGTRDFDSYELAKEAYGKIDEDVSYAKEDLQGHGILQGVDTSVKMHLVFVGKVTNEQRGHLVLTIDQKVQLV